MLVSSWDAAALRELQVDDGEGSNLRNDGRREGGEVHRDVWREGLVLLLRRMQGDVREGSRTICGGSQSDQERSRSPSQLRALLAQDSSTGGGVGRPWAPSATSGPGWRGAGP